MTSGLPGEAYRITCSASGPVCTNHLYQHGMIWIKLSVIVLLNDTSPLIDYY